MPICCLSTVSCAVFSLGYALGIRHTLQQMRPGESCGQTSCSTCGMRRRGVCSGDRQGAPGAGVRAQERCSVRHCWRDHNRAARWHEQSSPSAIAVQGTDLESATIDEQPGVSPSECAVGPAWVLSAEYIVRLGLVQALPLAPILNVLCALIVSFLRPPDAGCSFGLEQRIQWSQI